MAQQLITGAVLREGNLDWTILRSSKGRLDVLAHDQEALPYSSNSSEETVQQKIAALKKLHGRLRGLLCLSLPSDKVLVRVVDLPTIDPDEMRSMIDLQVDKFSPFPIEHMSVSFEVLEKKSASSLVLIAAVQREVVDNLGGPFLKAGFLPHWIDIEVMGWWYLLREAGRVHEQGRQIFVLLDHSGTELLVSQDGRPVLFRSLGSGEVDPELTSELVEEIGYTMTSLEAEWGGAAHTRVSVWHWNGQEAAPKLADELTRDFGAETQLQKLDDLPLLSEGLGRRAATRGDQTLDLTPPEWHQKEQARKTRKGLIVATAAFLSIWLILIAGFILALNIQRNKLVALKTQVEQLEAPALEVRRLQGKVKSFEQYADRTHSSLECLLQVTTVLPNGVDLTSFIYKKGSTLNLRGESDSAEPIYDFFQALEQSKFFTLVKPEGVTTRMQGNRSRAQFGVTLGLPGEQP
jgi:Tfp pilus assembly protein PilN